MLTLDTKCGSAQHNHQGAPADLNLFNKQYAVVASHVQSMVKLPAAAFVPKAPKYIRRMITPPKMGIPLFQGAANQNV